MIEIIHPDVFPETPAVIDYPLEKGEKKGLTGSGEDVFRIAKNAVTLFNHQHFTHLTEISLHGHICFSSGTIGRTNVQQMLNVQQY